MTDKTAPVAGSGEALAAELEAAFPGGETIGVRVSPEMWQRILAALTRSSDGVGEDLAACERAIERMGWPEIDAFMREPGQSPREDAGGYLLRKIKTLFGIKPDKLETYREAATRLVEEARANGGGSMKEQAERIARQALAAHQQAQPAGDQP